MKIMLVSDSPRPNLALAKIAAFHRARGDMVELAPSMDWALMCKGNDPDAHIVASWIFKRENGADVEGGPASLMPDYKLKDGWHEAYPDWQDWPSMKNATMGHLTRGCPNRCPWCVVWRNEAWHAMREHVLWRHVEVSDIWRGEKHLTIMDANLLALKNGIPPFNITVLRLLSDLATTRAQVNFEQGLDCRCIDEEIAAALVKIRMKRIQIACDTDEMIQPAIDACRHIWNAKPTANISCFFFADWRNDGWLESVLRRIEDLHALDHDINYERHGIYRLSPFVMLWDRENAPQQALDLQRWANRREVFFSTMFADYKNRRV